MSDTPGNMVREYIAKFSEMDNDAPLYDFDYGWNAALNHVCKELENLTSKIEGWEIRQENKA